MKSFILPPGTDVIDEVLKGLTFEGRDYSRNLVVFPNKRPAHILRKRLADKLGAAYLPPHILSADSFIEYLYHDVLGLQSQSISELDAVAVLLELQGVLSKVLIDDRNLQLESFLPFGLKLFQELEDVRIGSVSASQLSIQINHFLDEYDVPELIYLRDFYPAFYETLEDRGLSTRAMQYSTVAASADVLDFKQWQQIIIAGYAAPNASERLILNRLAQCEQTLILFQEANGLPLKESLSRPYKPVSVQNTESVEPRYSFYESSDMHGQLFALASIVNDLQAAGIELDEKTVIVLPKSETLFPLLTFGIAGVPESQRNISLGFPLKRSPVYEFIMALLHCVASKDGDQYFAPAFLELILHPYTKNILIGQRADVTRILMHTIQEEFFTDSSKTYFSFKEILKTDALFKRCVERLKQLDKDADEDELRKHAEDIHRQTLERLEHASSIGGLATALREILKFIAERSTAARHPLFEPFVNQVLETLDELAQSGIAEQSFSEMSSYERLLQRVLGESTTAFPGTPVHGLQVLGLLETRTLKFDRVLVLDANEDVLPGGRGSDMLLPQQIRERLGLASYREREGLTEHYFQLLCQSASEVHLFYRSGKGAERSRFVEQILWKEQRKAGSSSDRDYVKNVQYKVALHNPVPGAIEKTSDMSYALHEMVFSASALDTYLLCPLKFYYSYVLRIREPETASSEIEAFEIGNTVHKILERYFDPLIGKPLDVEAMSIPRMDELITTCFNEQYGNPLKGESLLVKMQVQRRLREFLELHQRPLVHKQSVMIQGLEQKIKLADSSLKLNGVIDRVETRDGQVFIIDYKTGASVPAIRMNRFDPENRQSWSDAVGSLQLPFYVYLYSEFSGIKPEDINPRYLHLGKAQLDYKTELGVGKAGTRTADWYEAMREMISTLVAEIHNPDMAFLPSDNLGRACTYCQFRSICGTRWL
jgi:ATP-dependent helicase/nuclease subunit B